MPGPLSEASTSIDGSALLPVLRSGRLESLRRAESSALANWRPVPAPSPRRIPASDPRRPGRSIRGRSCASFPLPPPAAPDFLRGTTHTSRDLCRFDGTSVPATSLTAQASAQGSSEYVTSKRNSASLRITFTSLYTLKTPARGPGSRSPCHTPGSRLDGFTFPNSDSRPATPGRVTYGLS